jgi:hypothetical protein
MDLLSFQGLFNKSVQRLRVNTVLLGLLIAGSGSGLLMPIPIPSWASWMGELDGLPNTPAALTKI